nr:hypothetical protein [Tanacetum cinerariifolium]
MRDVGYIFLLSSETGYELSLVFEITPGNVYHFNFQLWRNIQKNRFLKRTPAYTFDFKPVDTTGHELRQFTSTFNGSDLVTLIASQYSRVQSYITSTFNVIGQQSTEVNITSTFILIGKSNAIFALSIHGSTSSVGRKPNAIFVLPGHGSTSSVSRMPYSHYPATE